MEALILAGGRAERLGKATGGLPKPLVSVAGRPLLAWTVGHLRSFGVTRVVVACRAGSEELFTDALAQLGVEVATASEREPLGRGGGLRLAASLRSEQGPVLALNGDELLDVDVAALLSHHARTGAAATIVVAPMRSPFGVVTLEGDLVSGFDEAPSLPYWISCGVYVLGPDALDGLPEEGDHERSTFPSLAAARRLAAFRHEGTWLTVNTPKDLRVAEDYLSAHPDWLAPA